MQKVLSNKFILRILVGLIVMSFFITGVAVVYAEDTDGSTDTTTTSDDSDDIDDSDESSTGEDGLLRPSSLPTRVKARVTNFLENRGSTDNNDTNGDGVNDGEGARSHFQDGRGLSQEERDERREELQEKQDERREELQEKQDERREELNEKRKDRIKAYIERILHRFDAAIERLEKLADRVDSRIAKLEEERGVDLSEASDLVGEARIALWKAKDSLSGIESEAIAALKTGDPKTTFGIIREILNVAKEDIKSAHKKLVEAIRLVKASQGDHNDTDASDETDNN